MEGFLYVMSNRAMPGLLKVGMTTKMPHLRAVEMSGHEGIPTRMQLEYYALVTGSVRELERIVHKALEKHCAGKEWFNCSPQAAVAIIRECASRRLQYERFFTIEREEAEAESSRRRVQFAADEERSKQLIERQRQKEEIIKKLTSDLEHLNPRVTQLVSKMTRPILPARVETMPICDVLILAQYQQAKFLLGELQRLPKPGWLEVFFWGDDASISAEDVKRIGHRLQKHEDREAVTRALYSRERIILEI